MATRNVSRAAKAQSADPQEVWPGFAQIDRMGAALARDMLYELEDPGSDEHGVGLADYSSLEDWPRRGRPFRNVVAEYAAMAQAAGPEVLDGFYAVLSDYVSIACNGATPDAVSYDRHCDTGAGEAAWKRNRDSHETRAAESPDAYREVCQERAETGRQRPPALRLVTVNGARCMTPGPAAAPRPAEGPAAFAETLAELLRHYNDSSPATRRRLFRWTQILLEEAPL